MSTEGTQLLGTKHDRHPQCLGCCRRSKCCLWTGVVLAVFGVVLIVTLAAVLPKIAQELANDKIADRYVPRNGTSSWTDWLRNDGANSPPEYFIYHFYNLSNAHDVIYHAAYPQVEEIGPFVYQYHSVKQEVQTIVDGEISYKLQEYYTWVNTPVTLTNDNGEEYTYNSLDPDAVKITTFDPVFFATVWQVLFDPLFISSMDALSSCKIFSLSDLQCFEVALALLISLHGGPAESSKISYLLPLNDTRYGLTPTRSVNEWLGIIEEKSPESLILSVVNPYVKGIPNADNKWSYFYNTSLTDYANNGTQKIRRQSVTFDRDNLANAEIIRQWNGARTLISQPDFAKNHSLLNVLNFELAFAGWGDEVSFQSNDYHTPYFAYPNIGRNDTINVWLDSGARYVETTYTRDIQVKGVNAYQFRPSPFNFDLNYVTNHTFFNHIYGLANETQYHQYGPVFISPPHFYGYDQLRTMFPIVGMVEGDKYIDGSFADFEPISGIAVRGAERLQVNVMTPYFPLSDSPHLYDWNSVKMPFSIKPGTLVPVMWFERRSELTDSQASDLKTLQDLPNIKKALYASGGAGGGIVLILGVILAVYGYRKKKEEDEETSTTNSSSASAPAYSQFYMSHVSDSPK